MKDSENIAIAPCHVVRRTNYPGAGTRKNRSGIAPAKRQEEIYQLDFRFPFGLTTNYGKTLAFRQEMTGQARIITEDRRVLDRIMGRLRDLVKNQ